MVCDKLLTKGEGCMSNDNYWEDEDDNQDLGYQGEDDGIKNLRKAKRANEKYIKELEAQLGTYIAKDYERTVNEVLKSKGVNTKAARLILNDLDEVNEDTVNNWLLTNGDLIGFQPKEEQQTNNDADIQALKKQDNATHAASAPSFSDDIELKLANATTEEEVLSILNGL